MSQHGRYADTWARHRLHRRRAYAAVALAALAALGAWAAGTLERWAPGAAVLIPILIPLGGAVYLVESVRANRLRCPRCRRPFFERHGRWVAVHNSFARRCLNCGLPMGAPSDHIAPAG